MTAPLAARLRRFWLDVHLWSGVGLLAAIIPLSLSGSVLVWHDGLERLLHPGRFAVSGSAATQPLSAYEATARQAFGHRAVLTQLRLPAEAGDPVVANGRMRGPTGAGGRPKSMSVWIDPPTARALASAETSQGFTQVMHRLHGTLYIPDIGRKVVGWIGWAMFVSCATGLWLWWPRNGAVLKALRWRRGPSKLFNLHHMIGFWICLPLAVLSLTGVYISFPDASRAVFGVKSPQTEARQTASGGQERSGDRARDQRRGESKAPQAKGPGGGRFAPPIDDPRLTFEQARDAALAANPGATLVSIGAPTKSKAPAWRVQLRRPGVEATIPVQVVDATGEVKPDRGSTRDPCRHGCGRSTTGPTWASSGRWSSSSAASPRPCWASPAWSCGCVVAPARERSTERPDLLCCFCE